MKLLLFLQVLGVPMADRLVQEVGEIAGRKMQNALVMELAEVSTGEEVGLGETCGYSVNRLDFLFIFE